MHILHSLLSELKEEIAKSAKGERARCMVYLHHACQYSSLYLIQDIKPASSA